MIEIDKFDDQALMEIVDHDAEIFQVARDLPISSTMELMKRVQVMGRDAALASVNDIVRRYENMKQSYDCSL